MFGGHVGAGMALSKVERRLNLGVFIFAAFMLDVLLWAFVLRGWESVEVPSDFSTHHQLALDLPYSHGLSASLGWSVLSLAFAHVAIKRPPESGFPAHWALETWGFSSGHFVA